MHKMKSTMMFELLPDEILTNIVQFAARGLSNEENVNFWKYDVFARVAPFLFRKMKLENHDYYSGAVMSGMLTMGVNADHEGAFQHCARVPCFETLEIDHHLCGDMTVEKARGIARMFKEDAMLEVNLDFVKPVTDIDAILTLVRELGKVSFNGINISYLTIVGNQKEYNTSTHNQIVSCVHESWASLKSFQDITDDFAHVSNILKKFGNTLEELSVIVPWNGAGNKPGKWLNFLGEVQTNCRKLTSITIHDPFRDPVVDSYDIVNFLISYGTQLVSVNLHQFGVNRNKMKEDDLKCIASMCPNLKNQWAEAGNCFSRTESLGRTLQSLRVVNLKGKENWKNLVHALKHCEHIEELEVWASYKPFKDLFKAAALKFYYLEKLKLHDIISAEHFNLLIAKKFNVLRKLEIKPMQMSDLNLLKLFIENNPLLEEIHLEEKEIAKTKKAETLAIVKTFVGIIRKLKCLQKIDVRFKGRILPFTLVDGELSAKKLMDICNPLRLTKTKYRFSFGYYSFSEGRIFAPYDQWQQYEFQH